MEGSILIVDDEAEILKTLSSCLTMAGYHAHGCRNPVEALERLEREHYSVVLCDIMMPQMNGVDLLRQIRHLRPLTNVIMMTAYTSMDRVVDCLGNGAVDYLVKPFQDLDLVVQVVGEAADRVARWRGAVVA